MNNRVVHFEIPASDPEKTIDFFKTVFKWNFRKFGTEEYWMAITGKEGKPGINGAIMKRRDPAQHVVNAISVTSIDETLAGIEKAGGQIVVPKVAIPGVGYSAYFKDPDGNIHGVWQESPDAK